MKHGKELHLLNVSLVFELIKSSIEALSWFFIFSSGLQII